MKKVITAVVLTIMFLMIPFAAATTTPAKTQQIQDVSNKLLRLHVIANSDSEEDQQLKRQVRDAIIHEMNATFENLNNINDSKKIIEANLDKIEAIAQRVIKQKGKDYKVKAEFGTYPFPTKRYGDITLPAGKYQALRVVIGKGQGSNWWCVLFPPLCFIDITHGLTDEKAHDELKKVLDKEEFKLVVNTAEDENVPIEIRFKILDMLKNIKAAAGKNLSNKVPPSPN